MLVAMVALKPVHFLLITVFSFQQRQLMVGSAQEAHCRQTATFQNCLSTTTAVRSLDSPCNSVKLVQRADT